MVLSKIGRQGGEGGVIEGPNGEEGRLRTNLELNDNSFLDDGIAISRSPASLE